jgi:hypothetical protein
MILFDPNIVRIIAEHGTLSEEHRQELIQNRMLRSENLPSRFITGRKDCLSRAKDELLRTFSQDILAKSPFFRTENGELYWSEKMMSGKILIVYRNAHGEPFFIRPHKDFWAGAELQIYGVDVLHSGEPAIISEGEFKVAVLHQDSIPAIAVPGISSFVGTNFPRLRDAIRDAGVSEVSIIFDNDDRENPQLPDGMPNPHYRTDSWDRYAVQINIVKLARLLSFHCIPVQVLTLPDSWRIGGKLDIDSAVRSGHSVGEIMELERVPWEQYLAAFSGDVRQSIEESLGEGQVRETDGKLVIRDFPLSMSAKWARKSKKVEIVTYLANDPVNTDLIDLTSSEGREVFAKKTNLRDRRVDQEKLLNCLTLLAVRKLEMADRLPYNESSPGKCEERKWPEYRILDRSVEVHDDCDEQGSWLVKYSTSEEGVERTTQRISNFTCSINRVELIEDGVEQIERFDCTLKCQGKSQTTQLTSLAFESPQMMGYLRKTGLPLQVEQGNLNLVRNTTLELSQSERVHIKKTFGWDAENRFLCPSDPICPPGIDAPDCLVSLDGESVAQYLFLKKLPEDKVRELLLHFKNDVLNLYPHSVTYPLVGFAFGAPLYEPLGVTTRYAAWLRGATGRGKSFLAIALQCLWGNFDENCRQSWSSTTNAVEKTGFYFKDALFLVDDYKLATARPEAVISLVQRYADRQGRDRLRRDSSAMGSYPIRGALLVTGEDSPVHQSSVAARILFVDMPDCSRDYERGDRVKMNRRYYSAIMRSFLQYQANAMHRNSWDVYQILYNAFLQHFRQRVLGAGNDARIAENIAHCWIGFLAFIDFLFETEIIPHSEFLQMYEEGMRIFENMCGTAVREIQQESGVDVFIRCLTSLLAAKKLRLDDDGSDILDVSRPGAPVCGRIRGSTLYLVTDVAYNAVFEECKRSGAPFPLTKNALSKELDARGFLSERREGRLTVEQRFSSGITAWCWAIPVDRIGMGGTSPDNRQRHTPFVPEQIYREN